MIRGAGPNRVRIQGGRWKGRALTVPASARPTSGRARAALFDVLGEQVRGARVLDLYAGSGAVGLEAVSRGAAGAVLVDAALDTDALRHELARWGTSETEVRLLRLPAGRALERLAAAGERFDLVFADPPYTSDAGNGELAALRGVVAAGGVVVVQSDGGSAAPAVPGLVPAEPVARRAYGRNVFHFLGVFDATPRKC